MQQGRKSLRFQAISIIRTVPPPPHMISHNYTNWYDVQLFGIPAYGTGQVSYSFTPIL